MRLLIQRKRNDALIGFTLIEVIIASVLTALAALAAYHSYSQGILIWKKGQVDSRQDQSIMFMERVCRELKNSFAFAPVGFSGEETKISFALVVEKYDWGQDSTDMDIIDESISQTCTPSSSLPLIAKITYEYHEDDKVITRTQEVYAYPNFDELRVDLESTEKESFRTMLEDVEKLTFSYAITKSADFSFSSTSITEVPYAVKIELKLTSMKDPITRTVFIPFMRSIINEEKK